MHALGKVALSIKRRYHWSPSRECVEQGFDFLEVGGVKPLGEPVVDLRQQFVGLGALALALPQARQAQGGTQF